MVLADQTVKIFLAWILDLFLKKLLISVINTDKKVSHDAS